MGKAKVSFPLREDKLGLRLDRKLVTNKILNQSNKNLKPNIIKLWKMTSATLRSKIFVAKKSNAKILVREFSSKVHDLIRRENFRLDISVMTAFPEQKKHAIT